MYINLLLFSHLSPTTIEPLLSNGFSSCVQTVDFFFLNHVFNVNECHTQIGSESSWLAPEQSCYYVTSGQTFPGSLVMTFLIHRKGKVEELLLSCSTVYNGVTCLFYLLLCLHCLVHLFLTHSYRNTKFSISYTHTNTTHQFK